AHRPPAGGRPCSMRPSCGGRLPKLRDRRLVGGHRGLLQVPAPELLREDFDADRPLVWGCRQLTEESPDVELPAATKLAVRGRLRDDVHALGRLQIAVVDL